MTVRFSLKYLSALFIVSCAVLTYLWWGMAEHLVYLVTNVDAYSHGQLVPFISLGLIWTRRCAVKQGEAFVWFPGLLVVFGASVLWLAGEVGDVRLFGHIAYVTGLQGLILTVFGPNVYQRFLFPFLFLYLAVPFGEGLVPILQDVTAQLSVLLLAVSGVPYTLDGVFITLPSGVYEVAQACAGVRFLVTSLVTGILLAHLLYSGWKKRLWMIIASIIIPIFANVLRVFGIFLISEATDQTFAREVDHIVYGWGFLSAVLLILIAVAYKFADEEISAPQTVIWFPVNLSTSAILAFTSAILLFLIPLSATLLAPGTISMAMSVEPLFAPECVNCGVRRVSGPNLHDKSVFENADAELHTNFRIAGDQIAVSSALYCPQRPGAELLQVGNIIQGRGWLQYSDKSSSIHKVAGIPFQESVYTYGGRKKYVWTSYFIDGKWVLNKGRVRLETAKERLFKGVSAGAMLAISARIYSDNSKPRKTIEKLLSTFPPDSFLWNEIKPQEKGTIVCAE